MNAFEPLSLGDDRPDVGRGWVAPTAVVAGAVALGDAASVWYGAVLRGDVDRIEIGAETNLQDGCVVHTERGRAAEVGRRVTVGHRAVLHGCRIDDDVLVGMGAIVMNGARIGTGSIIAAGALVSEGMTIPPGSLVVGVPGKVRRETTDAERESIPRSARQYVELAARHRAALEGRPISGGA